MNVRVLTLASSLMAVLALGNVGPRPVAGTATLGATGLAEGQQASGAPAAAAERGSEHATVLHRYCIGCHNERTRTANLMLDQVDITRVADDAAIWEKVVQKLRTRAMPPAPRVKPDDATYEAMVTYLETALDRAAEARPNPGRPAVQRLNRAEYVNSVRDVLGLEVDGRAMLPADESGYGFDNIGDVLSISPGLLDRYLLAAVKVSRAALGDPTLRPATALYRNSPLLLQDDRASEDLPFGSRGGLAVEHHFPLDAEYVLRVGLQRRSRDPHQLEIRLDRGQVARFTLGTPEADPLEIRLPVQAGTRLVGVSFVGELGQFLPVDGRPPRPPVSSFAYTLYPIPPAIESIEVIGPFQGAVPEETEIRAGIFTCYPETAAEEVPCAREVLSRLARRAYRRPVTDLDVDPLMGSYQGGHDKRGFEEGIRWALESLLVSPKFLLRIEDEPADVPPGTAYHVSDIDLASRLSFMLWSSIPDEELLQLAVEGRLSEPAELRRQVTRMLADERSDALVSNFAGQWLYLRNLRTAAPNATLFPEFDDNLRQAFREETELFFAEQLRDDRSVLDLLRADYTFLNERLARHYGIPGVYGSHFRRVEYPDGQRAGVLGHGSVLTVTSYPNRTSPVVRGKWLLENLLGAPPPPPPPDVPALRENDEGGVPATVRARLEEHRRNPVCASCHRVMDPLGFALENFDAVGRWRDVDREAAAPIEPSGTMPNGSEFETPAEFRTELLEQPWQGEFVATLIEKLMTYALGRGVEYYDRPAIRTIMRDAAPDYRWSSLLIGIAESRPFLMRMSRDGAPATAP